MATSMPPPSSFIPDVCVGAQVTVGVCELEVWYGGYR